MHSLSKKDNARAVAFIDKTKKQAKNLFKLAKKNQLKIDIKNLSHAQEILAHINGYPDWHALEKSISNIENKNVNIENNVLDTSFEKATTQYKNLEDIENVFFLKDEKTIKSYILLECVPTNYEKCIELIDDIVLATNFQYNTGFHTIELDINQIENNEDRINLTENKTDMPYFTYKEDMGIEKELFYQLFSINHKSNLKEKSFNLQIKIIVSTDIDLLDEHIKFCKIFTEKQFSNYFSFIKSSNIKQNDYIEKSIGKFSPNNKFLLDSLLIPNNKERSLYWHNKWIYAIYLLCQRNHSWNAVVNIANNSIALYHSEAQSVEDSKKNDIYINGIYKSIHNTSVSVFEQLPKQYQKVFLYDVHEKNRLPYSEGLPLTNLITDKLEYYNPVQNRSHNILVSGGPGSGKSQLMNQLALSYIFSGASTPNIRMINIGPSSLSLIEFLKQAILKKDAKTIEHHKIKEEKKYCVNVFDTELGCRYPTPNHMEYLCNFINLLCCANDNLIKHDAIKGLIRSVIEIAYQSCSDNVFPKNYDAGTNAQIDQALSSIIGFKNNTATWWQVVDTLFKSGNVELAQIAQTYAVPVLSDLITAINHNKIKDIYGKVLANTGEALLHSFTRLIINGINEYKLLSGPTQFHSDANILLLDIDLLCKSGGPASNHKTAVTYMWARYILTKKLVHNIYDIEQCLYIGDAPEDIPIEAYKQYHYLLEEKLKDKKNLCIFDEYQRAYSHTYIPVKEQFLSDMRKSNSYPIHMMILGQNVHDFDKHYVSLANAYFIMGHVNIKQADHINETLSLTPSENNLLEKVKGPSSNISGTMFMYFKNYHNSYSKLMSLNNNISLINILSSIAEDVKIREILTQKIGYNETLKKLTRYYPHGITKRVEQEKSHHQYLANNDNEIYSIIEKIADELIEKA